MSQDRIYVNLQEGDSPEETSRRVMQEVISLTRQINQLNLPIVIGPGQTLPEGMLPGQVVIDWRSNISSATKVWNGSTLI